MTVVGTKTFLYGGTTMRAKDKGSRRLLDVHVFSTETLSWSESEMIQHPSKGSVIIYII